MTSMFSCVNCSLNFDQQALYKLHYKSEHHRYNVKRRLIGLPPLSLNEYSVQFESELSSKSSTQKQLHCELCSKKFMSLQTYKQHLNSQKHKNNRKKLADVSSKTSVVDQKSETSSNSQFSVIGEQKPKKLQCLFCSHAHCYTHLSKCHSYPPFPQQCTNIQALTQFIRSQIKQGKCIYCPMTFQCQQSAKQHMMDSGHAKMDLTHFQRFQKFYLWKITQDMQDQDDDQFEKLNQDNDTFEQLKKETLQSLERKRLAMIEVTNIGYIVNGKEVGSRVFKHYYKQNLARNIPVNPFRQSALALEDNWKTGNVKQTQLMPCRYAKSDGPVSHHR